MYQDKTNFPPQIYAKILKPPTHSAQKSPDGEPHGPIIDYDNHS